MADDKKKLDIFRPIASMGNDLLGARLRNGKVDIVEAEKVVYGKPINPENDLLSLSPREDGAFDVKEVYKGRKGASKGPAQVSTPQYRQGWDDVFGKPPKIEDMN